MNVTLIALAVLPVIVLAFYIYRQDKYEKEPLRMLLKAFFFGVLSAVPAIFMEQVLSAFTPPYPIVSGAYTGYVVAGCSEELCKLLLLSWAVWKSREFDEYFDGVVYSCFVALGFAGLENVGYVFAEDSFSAALSTGAVRAVLSVPGHFLFGVVMGYYFALAKFQPARRCSCLFKAFFYPMLLHGTFDALLMIPESMGADGTLVSGVLFIVFIWFDIKLWKIGRGRLRHLQELTTDQANQTRATFFRNPFDGIDWNV